MSTKTKVTRNAEEVTITIHNKNNPKATTVAIPLTLAYEIANSIHQLKSAHDQSGTSYQLRKLENNKYVLEIGKEKIFLRETELYTLEDQLRETYRSDIPKDWHIGQIVAVAVPIVLWFLILCRYVNCIEQDPKNLAIYVNDFKTFAVLVPSAISAISALINYVYKPFKEKYPQTIAAFGYTGTILSLVTSGIGALAKFFLHI